MLSYTTTTKKAVKATLNKNTILSMLILLIPALIYAVVSSMLLYNTSVQLTAILEEFMKLEEVTQDHLTQLLGEMVVVFKDNWVMIAIDFGVSILASLIVFSCAFLAYYASYCKLAKTDFKFGDAVKRIGGGIALYFAIGIRLIAWGLLFIVPAIVKFYQYSLAVAIKLDNPDKKACECIKESVQKSKGRRERLFVQSLFAILVSIVVEFALTTIVNILMIPYVQQVLASVCTVAISLIVNVVWTSMTIVFYNEIEFDEKVLDENPELRKEGATVVMRPDPDAPIRVINLTATPFVTPTQTAQNQSKPQYTTPFEEDEEKSEQPKNPFGDDNE